MKFEKGYFYKQREDYRVIYCCEVTDNEAIVIVRAMPHSFAGCALEVIVSASLPLEVEDGEYARILHGDEALMLVKMLEMAGVEPVFPPPIFRR